MNVGFQDHSLDLAYFMWDSQDSGLCVLYCSFTFISKVWEFKHTLCIFWQWVTWTSNVSFWVLFLEKFSNFCFMEGKLTFDNFWPDWCSKIIILLFVFRMSYIQYAVKLGGYWIWWSLIQISNHLLFHHVGMKPNWRRLCCIISFYDRNYYELLQNWVASDKS